MELVLMSPTQKTTVSIAWLEINTTVGNFVIQPGHAPTVLILAEHKPLIYCLSNGKQETLTVASGIVEITQKKATVLMQG